MDPNETLQILRHHIAEFQSGFGRISESQSWAEESPFLANELLETADTIAEAFSALDGWLKAGGFPPNWTQTK